jgi:peptidylprolyl isomerase/FKBP-type peptidyl-prolyl cis-trans isomerase SlyD
VLFRSNADNAQGRVLSVSGGRVRVDFNHPLAGKTLIYDLEIKEKVENVDEKIKSIIKIYTRVEEDKIKVKTREKEVDVEVPPMINSLYKKKISDDIMKILGFEKVNFVESFEKPKES